MQALEESAAVPGVAVQAARRHAKVPVHEAHQEALHQIGAAAHDLVGHGGVL